MDWREAGATRRQELMAACASQTTVNPVKTRSPRLQFKVGQNGWLPAALVQQAKWPFGKCTPMPADAYSTRNVFIVTSR